MANTLTINFTPASPVPSSGYLVRYWATATPGTILTTTVTSSPAVITGLSAYEYSGTIESVCSFGNSNRISFHNLLCNIVFNLNTVSPTNSGGTNGTATISNITGGSGTYTYSWNTSPVQTTLTATGLSTGISYIATVTDTATGCSASKTITVGETTFTFDADYMVITYQFTNGNDLDTRTRVVSIDGTTWSDQNAASRYLGWNQYRSTPASAGSISGQPTDSGRQCDMATKPLALWGGDNTGTGYESVLIDFRQLTTGQNEIKIDCRAFWYGTVGSNAVNLGFTLYKGGCPTLYGFVAVASGNPPDPLNRTISNATATSSYSGASASKVITAYNNGTNVVGASDLESPNTAPGYSRGQRIAVIKYNRSTNTGSININDTTTPAV